MTKELSRMCVLGLQIQLEEAREDALGDEETQQDAKLRTEQTEREKPIKIWQACWRGG